MDVSSLPEETTPSGIRAGWGLVVIVVVWLTLSAVTYWGLVRPRQHRFDFYPRWVGAQALLQGENPYSDAVTQRIQEGMFHTILPATEDQHRFLYTPFLALLLWPFWKMPFSLAMSLWGGLQLTFLFIAPLLWARILGWRLSPWQLAGLELLSVVVYRYPINGYVLGQFATWIFFMLLLALWRLKREDDWGLAAALLWALVKPEMALPLTALVLGMAWRQGRRRAVGLWFGGALALWGWSHWQLGFWEPAYLEGIRAYTHYARPVWPPELLGAPWEYALVVGMVGWMGVWGYRLWHERPAHWEAWLFAGAGVAFLLLWPQTGNYAAVLGLPALWMWLWARKDVWWRWFVALGVFALPWVFWFGLRPLKWEYLLMPLVLWGLLWWAWRACLSENKLP